MSLAAFGQGAGIGGGVDNPELEPDDRSQPAGFSLQSFEDDDWPDGIGYQLRFGERPVPVPESVRGAMRSIVQNLGETPADYPLAAGPGTYRPETTQQQRDPDDVWKGVYHEEGVFFYNEWDHDRKHYRKN
jgi:nitric oxide reductase NorD protein